mgnify:FL=1|jgi:hypothetical protein
MYVIHKQLIPIDTNLGDPNWAKRQVWVLKLNSNDTLDEFEDLESAEEKKNELTNSDPTGRIYKISIKNEDGSFSDV